MSAKHTVKRSSAERPSRGRADLARLRREAENDAREPSTREIEDLPDDFWDDAELIVPEPKVPISLRVDRDVLAWFREGGAGYQTLMNAVLRSYMEATSRK